ncbi:hypothetical protein GX50_08290 [[Emmonsia] crescens]|uniref:Methyltransferase n=1 Tax=[Emmonsia] crescens TaxID=73230 RepID=A0A2B7Z6G9_9EURO|nr:hypothetical protein GX50_08290 [Emmonsia crescens]
MSEMSETIDTSQHIAIDLDEETDAESSYSNELSVYSTSLSSSVKKFEFRHGRRYHSYQAGTYQFPNDEAEQDRLNMFHHALVHIAAGGKLFFAPIENFEGFRILDIGTELLTGIRGDRYPSAELICILGNDLSPIQPPWVPSNVKFIVDDVKAQNLKPGGWVEFQDYKSPIHTEDGSPSSESNVIKMQALLDEACQKMGRDLNPGPKLEKWVKDAGFVNIKVHILKLPISTWPKDKKLKELGTFLALQYTEDVDAFTNTPFTQILDWKKAELDVFNAKVKADALDQKVHALNNL